MRGSALLTLILASALYLLAGRMDAHGGENGPNRVVSMNLCTDQLAMLVAAPGQLHSVSWLAAEEQSSALANEAGDMTLNHGLAEEIFLMQPDLVIAGTYTTRATVNLLRKLGIPVEEFAPESSLEDIRRNITRMGEVLNRKERAREVLAEFNEAVTKLSAKDASGLSAATYYANSYTAGSGTLVDALISASGLENIASRKGFAGTAKLPLEMLLLAKPDILVDAGDAPATPALAHENFVHPAYRHLAATSTQAAVPAKYTICGGPFSAQALDILANAAQKAGRQ